MKITISILGLLFLNISFACELREDYVQTHLSMPYLAILPKGYNPQQEYNVVYFLHGRGGDRYGLLGLGVCGQLDKLTKPFIIIAPEGRHSYWMNGAYTHERWGDMVTQDLIADVQKKYRVHKTQKSRILAGISMGGHGAIQLALNHPQVYGAIGAHSPVFRTQEEASRDFYYEFGQGEDYQQRDPFSLINIKKARLHVPVYIDMGGKDEWIANTRNFQDLLKSHNIKGEFLVGADSMGGHSPGYWQYHLAEYLQWYSEQFE